MWSWSTVMEDISQQTMLQTSPFVVHLIHREKWRREYIHRLLYTTKWLGWLSRVLKRARLDIRYTAVWGGNTWPDTMQAGTMCVKLRVLHQWSHPESSSSRQGTQQPASRNIPSECQLVSILSHSKLVHWAHEKSGDANAEGVRHRPIE